MLKVKSQKSKVGDRKSNRGNVVIPLLIGLVVVAMVAGILVLGGRRTEEGKFELPFTQEEPGGQEEKKENGTAQVTILPGQTVVAGKQKFFLEISSPADGATTNKDKVIIIGKTVPGADISVNETELTAGTDGKFSTTISLEEGENPILVTAGNEDGFEEKEIIVYLEK